MGKEGILVKARLFICLSQFWSQKASKIELQTNNPIPILPYFLGLVNPKETVANCLRSACAE